jgi:hypothetical protein
VEIDESKWEFDMKRFSYQGIKKTIRWDGQIPDSLLQNIFLFIKAVEPFLNSCPTLDVKEEK